VLHDLQGLGSLTIIWVPLSDTWDRIRIRKARVTQATRARKEPNSSKEISHKGLIAWIFHNSYTYIDLFSESELG
jgi:hypothetical protein